ncbi:hybrid sensor histidine kinase/response regulator [Pseudanabaena mucicola]|uniref:histidine kinase n=1 Tax=Pseudanabaena mucicola FACHB-723 TaxID=2692860 RepID=A0ABR7ZV80_9CYAN|nr:hybrid sensor histidine kinase/response regulator [Pseudanabaena mucicola]MBD2187171.1 hybrid sensor histidine kinase/response regulator [Pseudanabaena mucicola FACHB-723]
MYSTETEIRDQAYQFFKQEAPEFLQTIETGLLSLREDRSTANVHAIMRAAHSIKGGSASLNLEGIKTIAHQLEDVFRSLYRFEGEIDGDVEGLLLQAYDCLRLPLMEQLQTGSYDSEAAIAAAEPIFEVLKLYLGDIDEDVELPTSAELGVDIVQIVFDGDVQQGITRLQGVLADPVGIPVAGEIRAQVEVFCGIGELLNLSGFSAIANTTLQALNHHPDAPILVGQVAVANFVAAREAVLAGDRTQGGQPSPELIALASENEQPQNESSLAVATTEPSDHNSPFEQELIESEAWFQSLEQEIDDISFSNPQTEASIGFSLEAVSAQISEELADDSILPSNDWDDDLDINLDQLEIAQDDADFYFDDLDIENIDEIDQEFNVVQIDANDEISIQSSAQKEVVNTNAFDGFHQDDEMADISELSHFFEPAESALAKPYQVEKSLPETVQTDQVTDAKTINLDKYVVKESSNAPKNATPYIAETIRVDLPRLDRLNNFSSELVTQENASILQNQQLQAKIQRIQKQFKNFDQLSRNLQTWLDQAQKSQVRTQSLSTGSQKSGSNNNEAGDFAIANTPTSNEIDLLADFDPLQMDSYSNLHVFIQEALEDIAQMDEGMRDMTVLMQQTQQTQRRKQQILKQLRYDLLWARMLPLGDILTSLPRMVREMSNKYNKQVSLKLFGTGTLVDKSVLEKLYDPFVHLVRNAFDHGTESAQERAAKGKAPIASIEIRAYYRGNQTYIEIKDDGRGINLDNIKAKAIAVGLLDPSQADQIKDEEAYQLLFAPSFSTADVVSEISGRGMGLSTVQEQVRSLKGSIEIKSELGQGTTFIIKLPLTLSIAKLMIFSIQERLIAIAIDSLIGIVPVEAQDIQIIQGKEFYRFEDRLIPLYPISIFADGYPLPKQSIDIFSTESFIDEENQTTLLLFANGNDVMALPIDRVLSEQELAIKPFGKAIAPPPYFYGCTVLGNGTLVPVIDSAALFSTNFAVPKQTLKASVTTSITPSTLEPKPKSITRKTILVVDDSLTARQALYLTLEKFGYQVIQASDGRDALEQLARSPEIQAVMCDVEMPNMNGFEFLAACRKDSRYLNIPIVMITSRGGAKHRGIAQMLGASGYLTKPYLEQELFKTIQGLLSSSS